MRFGENIRLLRIARRYSQELLANQVQIPQKELDLIERNEKEPSLDLIIRIANELEITVDLLLGQTRANLFQLQEECDMESNIFEIVDMVINHPEIAPHSTAEEREIFHQFYLNLEYDYVKTDERSNNNNSSK